MEDISRHCGGMVYVMLARYPGRGVQCLLLPVPGIREQLAIFDSVSIGFEQQIEHLCLKRFVSLLSKVLLLLRLGFFDLSTSHRFYKFL